MAKAARQFGEFHPRFAPRRPENLIFLTLLRNSATCGLRRGIGLRRSGATSAVNTAFASTISGALSFDGNPWMPMTSKLPTITKEP